MPPLRALYLVTFAVLTGLILLVTLLSLGMFGGGSPTLAAPSPLFLFLACVLLGPLGLTVPAVLFASWAWPLSRGQAHLPTRTLVLIGVLLVLSITYHLLGRRWWDDYGLGMAYIWSGYVMLLLGTALACRRYPRFWLNAAAHWLLFAWLASYAFPWYGEVP